MTATITDLFTRLPVNLDGADDGIGMPPFNADDLDQLGAPEAADRLRALVAAGEVGWLDGHGTLTFAGPVTACPACGKDVQPDGHGTIHVGTAQADCAPQRPADDRDFTRDEAITAIRAALRERTGRPWTVTGGRGTGWGWITLHAPPKRRGRFDYMGDDDRTVLAEALGLTLADVGQQGVVIPAQGDYRCEYVDRARGVTPITLGRPGWD